MAAIDKKNITGRAGGHRARKKLDSEPKCLILPLIMMEIVCWAICGVRQMTARIDRRVSAEFW